MSERRQAVLRTTQGWDLSRETSCSGFNISFTQPEDTFIKIVFKIDDELYIFKDGELAEYEFAGEFEDILQNGNTIDELVQIEGIVQFVRKRVYPIIILDAPADAEIMPKIKISLKVNCYRDEFSRDEISPIFELATDKTARITSVSCNKESTGYAYAASTIRLKNILGNWSDWIEFEESINKEACAVQFKNHCVVTEIAGADSVRLKDFKVEYVTDYEKTAADFQELVFEDQELNFDADAVHISVKHSELNESTLKCFVKFESLPLERENILIGVGNGNKKTYYLGVDNGIDLNINHNTLKITAGDKTPANFPFNLSNSTVELAADAGVEVRASYEYAVEDTENWVECSKQPMTYDGNIFTTNFTFENSSKKKILGIKIRAERNKGTVQKNFGTATGKLQSFVIPERTFIETFSCAGFFTLQNNILNVVAPLDSNLDVSYKWVGSMPIIKYVFIGADVSTR